MHRHGDLCVVNCTFLGHYRLPVRLFLLELLLARFLHTSRYTASDAVYFVDPHCKELRHEPS